MNPSSLFQITDTIPGWIILPNLSKNDIPSTSLV